jgi:phosphate transport system permease protein
MSAATSPPPPRPAARASVGDVLFRMLCQSAGGFVLLVALSLVGVLVWQSRPFLFGSNPTQLFTSSEWNPSKGQYGALVFIYGTIATAFVAMVVAVPLGVGAAAYLAEIATGRIRVVCTFLLELLAAIPSVVYGFWGIEFLARRGTRPFFEWLGLENTAAGQGILAAGLVLAVMVLPYITAVSFDVCRSVPRSQREGSLALGATRWQTIWRVVLPYARPGIVAACFLALGRAVGETMAVTMVIGNAQELQFSPAGTGDAIPSAIAKILPETAPTDKIKRAALVSLGLLLLLITLVTNVSARLLIRWLGSARKVSPIPESDEVAGPRADIVLPNPAPMDPAKAAAARRRQLRVDSVMRVVLALCQLVTVIPLFLILGYISWQGAAGVDWKFFTKEADEGGLGHAIAGSLRLVGLATVFAVPIGILAAVLLSEYRDRRFVPAVRFVAEQLGGVPSIVIGVFAYAVLVFPIWSTKPWGFSAWAGAFALGVMMLPVVIRASEEAMRLVPNGLREASYALGASRWQTVVRVIVPAALPAIITGVLLAVGRIAGETAPLLLTAYGSNYWPRSLGESTPFLPYYIFNYSKMPDGSDEIRLAWAAAFVLLMLVILLNVVTRLAAGKRVVAASQAG